jgi:hypothetical protein
MKRVQLFRNFLWFPIISIVLLNITFAIEDRSYHIPDGHYIILAVLVAIYFVTYLFEKRL